jgi:hypothetical protein
LTDWFWKSSLAKTMPCCWKFEPPFPPPPKLTKCGVISLIKEQLFTNTLEQRYL